MLTIYPVGDDKSDPRTTFDNRKFYKEDIYPSHIPLPIDYWYKHLLYGRVDDNNNVVSLKNPVSMLTHIDGVEDVLFVLNFVSDAYNDFKAHIQQGMEQGFIKRDAAIVKLKPVRAWENAESIYLNYLDSMNEAFFRFLTKNAFEDEIYDLRDFTRFFIKYTQVIADKFPVTFTAFLKSRYCTPLVSGLVMEFTLDDHNIDVIKYENFILDGCFELYANAAAKHGFYVDKNAPWRLTADISSPRMQKYMHNYGVVPKAGTASNFFELFHKKTFESDITLLSSFLHKSYNKFVELKPHVKKFCFATNKKKTRIITTIREKNILLEDADRLPNVNWTEEYYKLRLLEEHKPIDSKHALRRILKKAADIENLFKFSHVIRYINHRVKVA